MNLEFAPTQRLPQVGFQLPTLLRFGIIFESEDPKGSTSLGFGGIHSQIREPEQLVDVVGMVGRRRDANADVCPELPPLAVERRTQRLQYALRQSGQF